MNNEIIAAEIFLRPVNTGEVTREIDEKLADVEEQLNSLTCTASMMDYAVAVISGLLAGAIDAFYVKETDFTQMGSQSIIDQLKEGFEKARIKMPAVEKVEKPALHQAAQVGIPNLIPYLEKFANQPNPVGLAASMIIQAARGGFFVKENDKTRMLPHDTSKDNGIILGVAAAMVGILKWLSVISREKDGKTENGQFQILGKICDLIKETPAFSKVVASIETWQKQLPNELKCKGKNGESGKSVEGIFMSFIPMLAANPAFNNTKFQKAVKLIQDAKRRGITEIPIVKMLNKQAFPVLINEIIVRTMYFATRLAKELKNINNVDQLEWEKVLPFGNRTIDRLITTSSMTLTIADTADAAIHAAIDSCGNSVTFATSFVTRFNYVAAGRAAIAVVKEYSYDRQEADLIHLKRVLTETKTERALEILLKYQSDLENRVSAYLAEDIEQFLKGFEMMDLGLETKNSDLVIAGNVTIQRVLGRKPQFTNQAEFDTLIDSDIPLII